jgi:hypothetical protein
MRIDMPVAIGGAVESAATSYNLPCSLPADGAFLWIVGCRIAAANRRRPKLLLKDLLRVGRVADAAALADQILIGGA